MKLKSLMVAVLTLAVAGSAMAAKAPVKKHAHKKVHAVKHHHKAKHKKPAAM